MERTRRALLGTTALSAAGCIGVVGRPGSVECPATVDVDADTRLGLVGDVMLGRGVDERWADGPPAGVWGTVLGRLRSLDGLFCNLECCLSGRGRPRPHRTYHVRADPDWAVPAVRAGGATWASLANNHVLDFGSGAFSDTLETLSAGDIAHTGAGSDLDEALAPSLVEVDASTSPWWRSPADPRRTVPGRTVGEPRSSGRTCGTRGRGGWSTRRWRGPARPTRTSCSRRRTGAPTGRRGRRGHDGGSRGGSSTAASTSFTGTART